MKIGTTSLVLLALTAFAPFTLVAATAPEVLAQESAQKIASEWGTLLGKYVKNNGGVDYNGFNTDFKSLTNHLAGYEKLDPALLGDSLRKSTYINLYNAKILDMVLVANPRGSIKEISSGLNPMEIFGRDVLSFDEKMISLNDLEERLRNESRDPRIHFAVNCA